jgi:hypothetical protein
MTNNGKGGMRGSLPSVEMTIFWAGVGRTWSRVFVRFLFVH